MRPHQAHRLAVCLWAGGSLCSLAALGLTVYLVVASFTTPAKPGLAISTAPLQEITPPMPMALESFRIIWTAKLLEELPPALPVEKPQPSTPPPAPMPVSLPLDWAGVVVHSDPARSIAILNDKRTNRQLLLRLGSILPDSSAKVVEITMDYVKFQIKDRTIVIERPRPWKKLAQTRQPAQLSAGLSDILHLEQNKILIARPAIFAAYGLQSQDQIIAVAGKRVRNAENLAEAITGNSKATTEIAVLRQGKVVSLAVPTEVAAQFMTKNK